ncbi:LAMI_0G08328g1_1 [Lachancea mirantina]|uniref:LAMI_0G08328g1_1 n=1 Tax=Lachancea mirantina TaxID=1230905 RepID=A0A1G4K9V2_9SACH|nr:LAMI_0G08328g1_1 [Lachancea mirantina]
MADFRNSLEAAEEAVLPFDEFQKRYSCNCKSCLCGRKFKVWVPRLFFIGFLVPLSWLTLLGIWFCVRYWLEHVVAFPVLPEEEFPTIYELHSGAQKACVSVRKGQRDGDNYASKGSREFYQHSSKELNPRVQSWGVVENKWTQDEATLPVGSESAIRQYSGKPEPCPNTAAQLNQMLQNSRTMMLATVAADVLHSHDRMRRYYDLWFFRLWASSSAYILIVVFVVLIAFKSIVSSPGMALPTSH